jgi:hypothetical protein
MKLRSFSLSTALLFSFAGLAGCAADAQDEATDDAEVEASEDAITGDPSNYSYWVVTRRDFRRCMAPLCGGVFVKRVNQATSKCADGSEQPECYVSEISLAGIGLSEREASDLHGAVESGTALIKARMYKSKWNDVVIGKLKANEGWLGATGSKADGTFFRAASNGIVCVKAPCPSTTAHTLNDDEKQNVIDVRLGQTATPARQASLDRAVNALGTKEGILVAGGLLLPKCVPGSSCGPLLVATELYLRVTRREGKSCGGHTIAPTFCNAGQYCNWKPADICGAADASGVCTYKPDFCTKELMPVCGCDGNTYGNACEAAAHGASVSSQGACAK